MLSNHSDGGFRHLVAASGMSNLADGIFAIALPLVALTVTRDPAAFASVTVVGRLPWLLFALPAGAFADRVDRRRMMTAVNFARTALLGGFALILSASSAEMWLLYLVAFVLGVGETLFDTAGQSILPSIVEPKLLDRANGRLYAVELTANQFVGPPLGAFLAGVTLAGAVGSSSFLYLGAGVALALLKGNFKPERNHHQTRVLADVKEGARYLATHRLLRILALCVGISNLASTAMISILPLQLVAPGPVGLNETGYGFLLTSIAVGSVVGTTLVTRIRRSLGTRGSLLLATASFPLFSLTPALTTSIPLLVVGFFTSGALSVAWNVITLSLRQRIVPDHLLGRVNAGYRLVAWGTMPLGAAMGGAIAAVFGVTVALLTSAFVSSLCFLLVLFFIPTELVVRTENDEIE